VDDTRRCCSAGFSMTTTMTMSTQLTRKLRWYYSFSSLYLGSSVLNNAEADMKETLVTPRHHDRMKDRSPRGVHEADSCGYWSAAQRNVYS
jgi:hypothetical protein